VTPEELELFKREFRTSAYTCRLPSCPRATAGFDTNELRLEHEATHSQRLRCLYPGCQYPPFGSTRALKNHETTCHETVRGRKRIRRVAAWPQHPPEDSWQAERFQTERAQMPAEKSQPEQMGMGGQMMQQRQQQQQQQQRPPQGPPSAQGQIQNMIFQTLNQQTGPLSGWQAGMSIQERMALIFNL